MHLERVEGSHEVRHPRLPLRLVRNQHHSEAEALRILFGLADLAGPHLDLRVGGPVSLDLDLVDHAGVRVFREDVEPGVVVVLFNGKPTQ